QGSLTGRLARGIPLQFNPECSQPPSPLPPGLNLPVAGKAGAEPNRFLEIRMNRSLTVGVVAVLAGLAGGCCCHRQPCPAPCAPACPAPVAAPCGPAPCAPGPYAPGATYVPGAMAAPAAPVSMQRTNARPVSTAGQGAARGPASTMFEALRSWSWLPA